MAARKKTIVRKTYAQCGSCGAPLDGSTKRSLCKTCFTDLRLDPEFVSRPVCPYVLDCTQWPHSAASSPPDHICHTVAQASCNLWAAPRWQYGGELAARWSKQWPLPIGEQAMIEMAWGWQAWPTPATLRQHLPTPPTRLSNGCAGLVLERRCAGGDVTLFGMIEYRAGAYHWLEPITVQERRWNDAQKATKDSDDELGDLERQLVGWYRHHLLGKRVGAGGQTKIEDLPEEERAMYRQRVERARDLEKSGYPMEVIASNLGCHPSTLYRHIALHRSGKL